MSEKEKFCERTKIATGDKNLEAITVYHFAEAKKEFKDYLNAWTKYIPKMSCLMYIGITDAIEEMAERMEHKTTFSIKLKNKDLNLKERALIEVCEAYMKDGWNIKMLSEELDPIAAQVTSVITFEVSMEAEMESVQYKIPSFPDFVKERQRQHVDDNNSTMVEFKEEKKS